MEYHAESLTLASELGGAQLILSELDVLSQQLVQCAKRERSKHKSNAPPAQLLSLQQQAELQRQLHVERSRRQELELQHAAALALLRKTYGQVVDEFITATEKLHAKDAQLRARERQLLLLQQQLSPARVDKVMTAGDPVSRDASSADPATGASSDARDAGGRGAHENMLGELQQERGWDAPPGEGVPAAPKRALFGAADEGHASSAADEQGGVPGAEPQQQQLQQFGGGVAGIGAPAASSKLGQQQHHQQQQGASHSQQPSVVVIKGAGEGRSASPADTAGGPQEPTQAVLGAASSQHDLDASLCAPGFTSASNPPSQHPLHAPHPLPRTASSNSSMPQHSVHARAAMPLPAEPAMPSQSSWVPRPADSPFSLTANHHHAPQKDTPPQPSSDFANNVHTACVLSGAPRPSPAFASSQSMQQPPHTGQRTASGFTAPAAPAAWPHPGSFSSHALQPHLQPHTSQHMAAPAAPKAWPDLGGFGSHAVPHAVPAAPPHTAPNVSFGGGPAGVHGRGTGGSFGSRTAPPAVPPPHAAATQALFGGEPEAGVRGRGTSTSFGHTGLYAGSPGSSAPSSTPSSPTSSMLMGYAPHQAPVPDSPEDALLPRMFNVDGVIGYQAHTSRADPPGLQHSTAALDYDSNSSSDAEDDLGRPSAALLAAMAAADARIKRVQQSQQLQGTPIAEPVPSPSTPTPQPRFHAPPSPLPHHSFPEILNPNPSPPSLSPTPQPQPAPPFTPTQPPHTTKPNAAQPAPPHMPHPAWDGSARADPNLNPNPSVGQEHSPSWHAAVHTTPYSPRSSSFFSPQPRSVRPTTPNTAAGRAGVQPATPLTQPRSRLSQGQPTPPSTLQTQNHPTPTAQHPSTTIPPTNTSLSSSLSPSAALAAARAAAAAVSAPEVAPLPQQATQSYQAPNPPPQQATHTAAAPATAPVPATAARGAQASSTTSGTANPANNSNSSGSSSPESTATTTNPTNTAAAAGIDSPAALRAFLHSSVQEAARIRSGSSRGSGGDGGQGSTHDQQQHHPHSSTLSSSMLPPHALHRQLSEGAGAHPWPSTAHSMHSAHSVQRAQTLPRPPAATPGPPAPTLAETIPAELAPSVPVAAPPPPAARAALQPQLHTRPTTARASEQRPHDKSTHAPTPAAPQPQHLMHPTTAHASEQGPHDNPMLAGTAKGASATGNTTQHTQSSAQASNSGAQHARASLASIHSRSSEASDSAAQHARASLASIRSRSSGRGDSVGKGVLSQQHAGAAADVMHGHVQAQAHAPPVSSGGGSGEVGWQPHQQQQHPQHQQQQQQQQQWPAGPHPPTASQMHTAGIAGGSPASNSTQLPPLYKQAHHIADDDHHRWADQQQKAWRATASARTAVPDTSLEQQAPSPLAGAWSSGQASSLSSSPSPQAAHSAMNMGDGSTLGHQSGSPAGRPTGRTLLDQLNDSSAAFHAVQEQIAAMHR